MKKTFLPLATMIVASFTLAACGGSSETSASEPTSSEAPISSVDNSSQAEVSSSEEVIAKAVRPTASYVLGEKDAAGSMEYFRTYQVSLYEDNVYEFVTTQVTWGYNMNLATNVVVNYGTFTADGTEDGVSTFTLNKAAEVILSSFSKAGGFKIHINTADENQVYPTELPAKTQGEKNMAQSDADVIAAYGDGTKIYVKDNVISFIDPNSEEENPEKAVVTTPSGSVASVLNKNFKQVQVTSEVTRPYTYGDGSGLYTTHYLHVFEDDSYQYFTADVTFGYNMVLGTTNVVRFGQGAYGTGEDGVTPFNLAKADDVTLNSYSKAGGYSFAINTANEAQVYPTELPAKTQGEKNMAQSDADVINAYGEAKTLYTSDSDCVMLLNDPAEAE